MPQGSVLSQLQWTITYDGVLCLDMLNGVNIIGFADDIAIVVISKYREHIQRVTNNVIIIRLLSL